MSETRRVIGVCDHLVAKKDGIAFPSVRVWIRGPNDYETRGLEKLFPERGTIYLHVSTCENQHPQRNQVGLFNCIESPGQTAAWEVSTTSRNLARVIECPIWESNPVQLAFWEWLVGYEELTPCNILLSQGITYVRRGKHDLVGPLRVTPEGRLIARDQTLVFEGIDAVKVDIGGHPYGFIDTELLPKGKLLILDPREAIQRRLKHANRTGGLEWLSRAKVQELSVALAGVSVADGSEWVIECLPRAIESLCSSGNFNAKVAEAILQIESVTEKLEAMWKQTHAADVKKAEQEISTLKKTSDEIKQSISLATIEASRLQLQCATYEADLNRFKSRIDQAKTEAQLAFDAELKRLAQAPASLALLASWTSSHISDAGRAQPLIRFQRYGNERQHATNLYVALLNNLKHSGLLPSSAAEIATVCGAAIVAGQPISFRSLLADLLAEAVATSLGQSLAVWADVPAGLLDPIRWEELIHADQQNCPLILQSVNRSDIHLVLGSLHYAILRQALGRQKPAGVILMTLEPNEEIQVRSDFSFGPLIDDKVLKFGPNKMSALAGAFTAHEEHLPEIASVSPEEFDELGEDILHLPLFTTSAQELIFRRSYGGLQKLCEKTADVPRLFFKYWCLPRISSAVARRILEARKELWASDKTLDEFMKSPFDNA